MRSKIATALREIALLKQLRHPHVITLQNIVLDAHLLYLVFDLVDYDLKKLMDYYNLNKDVADNMNNVFRIENIQVYI